MRYRTSGWSEALPIFPLRLDADSKDSATRPTRSSRVSASSGVILPSSTIFRIAICSSAEGQAAQRLAGEPAAAVAGGKSRGPGLRSPRPRFISPVSMLMPADASDARDLLADAFAQTAQLGERDRHPRPRHSRLAPAVATPACVMRISPWPSGSPGRHPGRPPRRRSVSRRPRGRQRPVGGRMRPRAPAPPAEAELGVQGKLRWMSAAGLDRYTAGAMNRPGQRDITGDLRRKAAAGRGTWDAPAASTDLAQPGIAVATLIRRLPVSFSMLRSPWMCPASPPCRR